MQPRQPVLLGIARRIHRKVITQIPSSGKMSKILVSFAMLEISSVLWLRTKEVTGLSHGRDAEPGEFPFVMRIRIEEENAVNVTNDVESGNIATGVLVSPTKVLSTCSSVGFFTGTTVNKYNLSRVTIMGGSVNRTGAGGETQAPIRSVVHPHCYSLTAAKIVLFDFGLYELGRAFNSPRISPAKNPFRHSYEMTRIMRGLWEQWADLKCQAAGWGNPRKQFEGSGMPDNFERFAEILQTTDMRVTTYEHCKADKCNFLGDCLTPIWEHGLICAKAQKGGPCNEDEGGPLICGGVVIAIYSNVERCEDEGLPRTFFRLDLVYDFVYGNRGNPTIRAAHILMYTAFPITCAHFLRFFCVFF